MGSTKVDNKKIILDTHVWIWLVNGDEKVKNSGFFKAIDKAARTHSIEIPAIVTWEVAMLAAKNRITIAKNTLEWLMEASSAPGLSIYPLSPEVAYESTVLPGDFHGDPADRMIVATARVLNGTLLTFDKQILDYSKKGYVKTLKPKL